MDIFQAFLITLAITGVFWALWSSGPSNNNFIVIRNKKNKLGLVERKVMHVTPYKSEAIGVYNAFIKYDNIHAEEYDIIRDDDLNGKTKKRYKLI